MLYNVASRSKMHLKIINKKTCIINAYILNAMYSCLQAVVETMVVVSGYRVEAISSVSQTVGQLSGSAMLVGRECRARAMLMARWCRARMLLLSRKEEDVLPVRPPVHPPPVCCSSLSSLQA